MRLASDSDGGALGYFAFDLIALAGAGVAGMTLLELARSVRQTDGTIRCTGQHFLRRL
jgi:hypothetical protein